MTNSSVPSPAARPTAYIAALVVYVVLGFMWKSAVLNWIVGPLFPLVVLHLVPKLLWPHRHGSTR